MADHSDVPVDDTAAPQAHEKSDVHRIAPRPELDTMPPPAKDLGRRAALAVFVALLMPALIIYLRWLFSKPSLSDVIAEATSWLRVVTGNDLAAIGLAFGPLLGLLVLVAVVLVHFGMPQVWQSARRSLQLGALLGACLAAAWFIGTARLAGLRSIDWLFFIPIVPPALLAFQAMVTWRQRPRSVGDFRIGVSTELRKALEESGDVARFEEVHAQLLRVFGGVESSALATAGVGSRGAAKASSRQGAYNPTVVATQFALPALLLLIVGFGAMALAVNPHALEDQASDAALRGLKWGVCGAYTYVLFTFGSRSFRNDLTVGAATWAVITLITGPTLAVVLALVWKLEAKDSSAWQSAVVLFFAGLAPRQVMTIIESTALQFLKSTRADAAPKLVPLTSLRGISAELAARLREENIEDVIELAYADPIRLVQALPYDLRQVVEWIDQAQLAVVLPDLYETLLQRGITGAIDLAWRWLQACLDPATGRIAIGHIKDVPDSFKALVREPEREASIVYEAARQMFYEEQVRLLWVMYNCFSTTAGGQSSSSQFESSNASARSETPPSALPSAARMANESRIAG